MNVTNINSPDQHQYQQGRNGYYDQDPRHQSVGGQVIGAGSGNVLNLGGEGSQNNGGVVTNTTGMVAEASGYYMGPMYSSSMPTMAQQNAQQFSDAMFNSFLAQFGGQLQQGQQYTTSQCMNQYGQNQQAVQHVQGQNQAQHPNSQRYFHAVMSAAGDPGMLEFQPQLAYTIPSQNPLTPMQHQQYLPSSGVDFHGNGVRRGQMQFQDMQPAAVIPAVVQPKKMSTTQSRIEKRKRLKKQGPKRPSSAYFLFSMSIREELLRQYPDAKVPELSKLSSARWKELSEDDKKPFYVKFKDNWEKYRVARKEYEATLPPKRPSGPFIQFTSEMRPKLLKDNPDKSLIEITKIVGEQWRGLPSEEKQKYTDAYKQKLKEWEEFYPDEDANPIKNPITTAPAVNATTASKISVNTEH